MVRTRSGRRAAVPSHDALGNTAQLATASKPTLSASVQWEKLPLIVQEAVLRELAQDYNRHSPDDKSHRAAYAAVSLQWQDFFEKLNFNKLVLHPSALKYFGKLVKRRSDSRNTGPSPSRMPRIQHIWLCIELLPYDCTRCKLPEKEDGEEAVRNNRIFTKAIGTLLKILSDWEQRVPNHKQALNFELSAHSPSDAHHCFQDDADLQPDYPNLDPISTQRDYIVRYGQDITGGENQLNDLAHGYSAGQFSLVSAGIPHCPEGVAERLIRPLKFDFFGNPTRRLPEVKMISSFVLRRQFYREPCPTTLNELLWRSLIGLRNIRYERWRLPDFMDQKTYETDFGFMIRNSAEGENPSARGRLSGGELPLSLESLSLVEETSSKIAQPTASDILFQHQVSMLFQSDPIELLKGLAGRASNLKHLSVSFLSDAMNCFEFPADAFPNLQSLALTSKDYLQPTEPTDWKVREILLAAAVAVPKLPKLQIMELWNCGDGHAAIFRYEAAETVRPKVELTWRSSRCFTKSTIGADVMAAWERVASEASRQLTFTLDPLPHVPYSQSWAILRHLKLRDLILDPTSTMQVTVGTEAEGQPEVPVWKATKPYSPVWKASQQD